MHDSILLQEKKTRFFHAHFSLLKDPRRNTKGNFYYPLDEILFLSIAGVLSGADDWVSISLFGKSKLDWLRQYFPYENGTPSHDVFGKLFALIDPLRFNECFVSWVNALSAIVQGEVIAIDGKSLCGSANKAIGRGPFHLVSAYAAKNRLCLGQQCVAEKSNEITAIPDLLDMLTVQGCVITIDAMGCQREIAQKIIDREADYILMVKDNQKGLREQVEKVFSIQAPSHSHQQSDLGHGRIEKRECDVIDNLVFLDGREKWPQLHSIVRIKSERQNKQTGQASKETRYYISSLKENAALFNSKVRQHWAIENNLHWELDILFQEDSSLMKKGNSAINFSLVKKMALALLEREKSTKMSKPSKRLKAALDDDYRSLILKT